MSAWPIEELAFRPVITVLLALLVPVANRRILMRLLAPGAAPKTDDTGPIVPAFVTLGALEALLAAALGFSAIAPALATGLAPRLGFALFTVVLSVGSGALIQRRVPARETRSTAREETTGVITGLALGLAILMLGILAERSTRIPDDAIAQTSADRAWRRLRIDPSDGNAMLALAWISADANDHERARDRIDEAERMGAPAAELSEARAELAALEGDCEGAWRHFDEALTARAALAFDAGELPELELGGYHLPSAMILHCAHRSIEE